jgi:GT2 family glycosyltransferase
VLTDVLVPHNRFDLLDGYPVPRPGVSVVVTHYRQPAQLARTWAALCGQTRPPVEVVIADDGSDPAPSPPTGGPPVRVVTQADRGFRAGAARNLGARHTSGEVLVFLDADTVPEPEFLERLTRRVALCPDVLAVGRRRHADLTAVPVGAHPATAPRLPEPGWLAQGYAATRDLLDADGRSFRYVISAVLACRRSLFDHLDGFDERFVGYGGEDWDLAYRAWNAGAVLAHEPTAVAWHDGPDWGRRGEDPAVKRQESARLAALIPEPSTRGDTPPGDLPDVLVEIRAGAPPATRDSVLRQSHGDLLVGQPGGWSPDQLRRARARVEVGLPLPPGAVAAALAALVDGDLARVVLRGVDGRAAAVATATRAAGRAARWRGRFVPDEVWGAAFGTGEVTV